LPCERAEPFTRIAEHREQGFADLAASCGACALNEQPSQCALSRRRKRRPVGKINSESFVGHGLAPSRRALSSVGTTRVYSPQNIP
jgi:hypothetical protein